MKTYFIRPDKYFIVSATPPRGADIISYDENMVETLSAGNLLDAVVVPDKPSEGYRFDEVTLTWFLYSEPEIVPSVVSMRQARLALLESGMLSAIDNAITVGTNEALKIEWDYATEVRRDWKSLVELALAMGITTINLDNLFVLASTK